MQALKTSIFSFIIINIVNEGTVHFFITNGLSTVAQRKNLFMYSLVEHFKKFMKNAKCISF